MEGNEMIKGLALISAEVTIAAWLVFAATIDYTGSTVVVTR